MSDVRIRRPANRIPSGSVVTKPCGSKEYVLSRGLKIYDNTRQYGDGRGPKVVRAYMDNVFLLNPEQPENVSEIDADKELVWHVSDVQIAEALDHLERKTR